MAKKISELDELAAVPADTDQFEINDGGISKRIAYSNIIKDIVVADLADATDGELITWDSNGVPTTVAVGTNDQVLTSNGVGAAPTFQELGVRRVVKSADETVNNSITNQDDNELLMSVAASTRYGFKIVVFSNSAADADIKGRWTIPSGASGRWEGSANSTIPTVALTTGLAENGGGDDRVITYEGFIKTDTTAGTLQFQWAQATAQVSDTKVLEGSYLLVWKE